MEIDDEGMGYMDEDHLVLMLGEEGTYQEPPAIVEAITELKNYAQEGVAHPMKDSVKKIMTIKSVTLAKKIKIVKPITLTKNIISIPIVSILLVFLFMLSPFVIVFQLSLIQLTQLSRLGTLFPFNMIYDSAYLLALNAFIFEIGKETLNNKELKHGHLEPIKEETQPINMGTDNEPKIIQVGNTLTA